MSTAEVRFLIQLHDIASRKAMNKILALFKHPNVAPDSLLCHGPGSAVATSDSVDGRSTPLLVSPSVTLPFKIIC